MTASLWKDGNRRDFYSQYMHPRTPTLHSLVISQDHNACESWLQTNTAVNEYDEFNATALHHASALNNAFLVNLLLGHGAQIDCRDKNGRTPLFLASCDGYADVVKMLVENGAAVDLPNLDGVTPLASALFQKQFHIVDILAKLADVDVKWNCKCSTLIHIATDGTFEMTRQILKLKPNMELRDEKRGMTALHYACIKGNLQIVRLLIENGADINAASKKGEKPIHVAAGCGFDLVVKYLYGIGCDLNAKNADGLTPLHLASKKGHEKVVKVLLELGCTVDPAGPWTPLHLSCRKGRINVVKLLVDYNADINRQGGTSLSTPLHFAAKKGFVEVVELLISHGANAGIKNKNNKVPMHRVFDDAALPKINIVKILNRLFWEDAEDYERARLAVYKEAAENAPLFCLDVLFKNDGRFNTPIPSGENEKKVVGYYNVMMFRWVLKQDTVIRQWLLPELYCVVEEFLLYD